MLGGIECYGGGKWKTTTDPTHPSPLSLYHNQPKGARVLEQGLAAELWEAEVVHALLLGPLLGRLRVRHDHAHQLALQQGVWLWRVMEESEGVVREGSWVVFLKKHRHTYKGGKQVTWSRQSSTLRESPYTKACITRGDSCSTFSIFSAATYSPWRWRWW